MIAITEKEMSSLIGDMWVAFRINKYLNVTWITEKKSKRSLDQNAIFHAWCEQIATELREGSALLVKAECKLLYGVPILRAECPEFRESYDSRIRNSFNYEQKLILMESFPVTSLMNKAQLSQLLERMQDVYRQRGVYLEFPNEN